ncbi:serine protease inhibitor 23 precursor [Bombyx mori]|uniref:Serpin-23 n=1 Tax=Bombyx mori TaxID=7091 RepID=C0J8H2_BOMMO|nr:serine protease inhibitor 23 precursor [Bombyx mori]ACG61186.1 serpin-23 [Bombyx mori]
MKKSLLSCLCSLFGLLTAAFIEDKNPNANISNWLAANSNELTRNLFFELQKYYPGKSLAVTSVPIFNILGQLVLYSKGETFETITDIVGLKNSTDVKRSFKIGNERTFDSDIPLRYTSKIYADDEDQFCPAFKKTYSQYFKGKTGNVDFDRPQKAAKEINEWVEEEFDEYGTTDLVDPSIFKGGDGFIVVGSLDLELDYNTGFNPTKVKTIDFYLNAKKKIKTPALVGKAIVKYAKVPEYDAQFISISLKGGDLTLFIILPDEINGLSKLIQKFRSSNAEVFTQISPFQEYKCVELHLPLGEILTQLDITKALKAIQNLDILFDKKRAQLSGVTKNCEPGVIKSFLTDTYLVDKIIKENSFDEVKKPNKAEEVCSDKLIAVEINRPFAFSIINNVLDATPKALLMAGVYYG